ncbi:nuclear transport factor 2 family protein [Lichenicoccus sp.]|uniref:nuclear transport factor 2 family protein n=1 Tax=Lichenicoccus sp. TaxID=2781899 RepID=UPI003D1074FD
MAIEALIHEHAWLIDHGQADRIVDLYTDDARLFGIGADKVGRDAISRWAAERAAMTERCSRHVQSNIRLVSNGAGQVQGTVLLTLHRFDGPGLGPPVPLLVAEYDDLYRHCDDGIWRFAQRRLTTVFAS